MVTDVDIGLDAPGPVVRWLGRGTRGTIGIQQTLFSEIDNGKLTDDERAWEEAWACSHPEAHGP